MTELMGRRRALMGKETVDNWTPIVTTWAISTYILGDGRVTVSAASAFGATSDYIAVQPGYQIRNDGPATGRNDETLRMFVHEYTGTTWKKRTYLRPNGGSICTISDGTDNIRLTFAYGSDSGMTIGQEDIETYAKPKGSNPILNPSVGLTENAKLDTGVSAPYIVPKTGAAVTDFIDAGTSGNFVFFNPNTPSLWESTNNRHCGKVLQYSRNDQNAQYTDNWNCRMSGDVKGIAVTTQKRYVRLALPMKNLAGVYAYNSATGQVFYAGINTPYYGKTNIND